MSAKSTFYVDAPVETVFEFLKDPGNTADLGFSPMEIRELKMTAEGTGTFYTWRFKLAGIPVEGFSVYTEFVRNERIVEESSHPSIGTWVSTYEPEGKGTRVTMEHRSRGIWGLPPLRNLFDLATPRLTERFFVPEIKKRLETLPKQRKPVSTTSKKRVTTG